MIVTAVDDFAVPARDKELPLEKYGAFGVLAAGEAGFARDMDSKEAAGIELFERWSSMCLGRSVGGRGAGPGFMKWPAL